MADLILTLLVTVSDLIGYAIMSLKVILLLQSHYNFIWTLPFFEFFF